MTPVSLYTQAILMLAALVLFTSFALLAQARMFALIRLYAWQGTLLAVTTALVAWVTHQPRLYISALLTLGLKALLIPWFLNRLVIRLGLQHETEVLQGNSLILLGAAALTVFSYYVVMPIVQLSTLVTRNVIAVSLAVILLGLLLIIVRRKAVTQVVGFMCMENGLFFAAVASTYGMPMVVELGVAFDVLVASILFGVFFLHIRDSIDSLDVDRLNQLREGDD